MAEEVLYSSGVDSNKRKYEDSPSRTPIMAKGFSSPPDSAAKQASYNNVPPPMNEFELAKQKAQEIAARLLSNADPSKRARVENGGAGSGGFSSSDYGAQRSSGFGVNASPQVASSGYPGQSKKIEIPNGRVGVIIGKGGDTIKYLQLQSGAKIQVTRDMDADPNSTTRVVELMGTPEHIAKAEQLISDVLSEAEAGASAVGSRRMTGTQFGAEQFVMKIPNNKVGLVIGKGGETIKNMQASTGARIQVIPLHLPPGDMSKERTVQIDGTNEQIEAAKQLVEEVISENRARNQSMAGGYSQQGYQARPPPNWWQPGPPMQQPGYGYAQPGAYPGPPPPYSQTPYSGYPQQPNSGGYSASWDQSTTPHNPQTSAQGGGGYDYYNQQPPQQQHPGGPGASADSSGYSYGQVPPYSQGQSYGQDGYGYPTAQTGYGQPQSSTGPGYDQQQQQGYNTYGTAPNPNSDGNASYGAQSEAPAAVPTPGQSYNAGGQPASNTNYPSQAPAQPGYAAPPSSQGGYATQTPSAYGSYGPPPGQKPPAVQPAYAQPQQSSGAQGGYPQAGYAQSQQPAAQPTYAQPDSSAQRPPSSGYQTGYGAPSPYGAPPANQPNYGQPPPPQYNTAYAAGYSQPPAYTSDGSAGSNARGGYDATPPSQTAQPSAAAKASPPS